MNLQLILVEVQADAVPGGFLKRDLANGFSSAESISRPSLTMPASVTTRRATCSPWWTATGRFGSGWHEYLGGIV
jgi:hypothetical protein